MTGECCGGSCSEGDPIQISSELEMKATAALGKEIEAELEAEDASLSELLDENQEQEDEEDEV